MSAFDYMTDDRQFQTEERAVSSVISTILMVAIAVILGAVVSVHALGIANDVVSPAPQVVFEFNPDYETGDITITKISGDALDGDQLRFSGAALEKTSYGEITEWAGNDVKSEDSATVDAAPGETLTLVWKPPDGGSSAILAKYDVPNDVGPTASIGSVETGYSTYVLGGTLTVKNIQFTRVQDDNVYVVVEAGPYTENYIFSNSGGDLDVDLNGAGGVPGLQVGDPITVTVYETESKTNPLKTVTV